MYLFQLFVSAPGPMVKRSAQKYLDPVKNGLLSVVLGPRTNNVLENIKLL